MWSISTDANGPSRSTIVSSSTVGATWPNPVGNTSSLHARPSGVLCQEPDSARELVRHAEDHPRSASARSVNSYASAPSRNAQSPDAGRSGSVDIRSGGVGGDATCASITAEPSAANSNPATAADVHCLHGVPIIAPRTAVTSDGSLGTLFDPATALRGLRFRRSFAVFADRVIVAGGTSGPCCGLVAQDAGGANPTAGGWRPETPTPMSAFGDRSQRSWTSR